MSDAEQLLQQYQGHIVPRSFDPGRVLLSFFVSLFGAASTLELLNRRTSRNGFLNHIYLTSAAITMGGIAIWSMHFVGNRATVLAQRQPELQVIYSSNFTAVSFFLPILVLFAAFVATGTNNHVSWWRIGGGGTLAGGGICGMHYIGNASIDNYTCEYKLANVIGSAVIAVVASVTALSIFFALRASWSNSWWKRLASAFLLAGAVSGMHWCAATGTSYRLIKLNENNTSSHNIIVILVTVLSFLGAFIVAGVVIHGTAVARRNASKARQVVLAAAVFDRTGRLLVNPDGLLPSEKITDTYIEKTPSDAFNIENPLFQWMFQASRNWSDINGMISGMTSHLASLSLNGRGRSVRLIRENGQLVDNYDVLFRELFCLAAASLANKLKDQLINVGILWDEILPTGTTTTRVYYPRETTEDACERGDSVSIRGADSGWGSLMFLVRHIEGSQDIEKLEAAGYRFAEIHQVSGIIRSGMQIKIPNLNQTFMNMARYAKQDTMLEPNVHLGFFGIRARVGGQGFDVLVEKGAHNLLPCAKMPLERLEPWHLDFLRQYDGLTMPVVEQNLLELAKRNQSKEATFASILFEAIDTLGKRINNRVFYDATLSCRTVQVPCQPRPGSNAAEECTMIALHLLVPIHYTMNNPGYEFVPLTFFKVHQTVYHNSPHNAAFTQHLHRELAPIVQGPHLGPQRPKKVHRPRRPTRFLGAFRHKSSAAHPTDADGNLVPTDLARKESCTGSSEAGSTLELWSRDGNKLKSASHESMPTLALTPLGPTHGPHKIGGFGGILVSQEIKVNVSQVQEVDGRSSGGERPSREGAITLSHDKTRGPKHGHTRSQTERQFELRPITIINSSPRIDQALGSTVVTSGSTSEEMTFVDELFSCCVERR